ncbi:MAG: hypothetical protein HY013_11715 [Candidatus Solibacter usitatus]|nr:hypothetical protein [Candidatus Solibacter usitatus]
MINGFDPANERFLAALAILQRRSQNAQAQISSGLRITGPADAPAEIADLLQVQSDLGRVDQTKKNLGRVKAEVDGAENAVAAALRLAENALTLGAQGAGSANAAIQRPLLAIQVRGLQEQLVALARTQVEGRFVFSGDTDQAPAYQLNLANPNGVDRLLTAPSTRLIQDAQGTSFAVAKTAQDIFDRRNPNDSLAADNLFAAFNDLRVALENNNQTGIQNALDRLHQASDHLNQDLAFYGDVQNRVSAANNLAEKFELQWRERLSQIQDADLPASILELTQTKTHTDAALSSQARYPRNSLFDFLR